MPPASANCALILRALPQYALTWSPANPALMMNATAAELGPQRDMSANNKGTWQFPDWLRAIQARPDKPAQISRRLPPI